MKKNLQKLTDKPVLVTGATGFVGTNLVRRLVKKNFPVHILVRPTSDLKKLEDIISRVHIHYCDLTELPKLKKIVKRISPKTIFHLATESIFSVKEKREDQQIFETNFLGTFNLVTACSNIDYSCFVHTGSSSEYGHKAEAMRESDQCQPINLYGIAKLAATLYCQMIAKVNNKPIITLRLFSPFGPFDSSNRLIPAAIFKALKGDDILLTKPTIVRDYVFVDDVVDAYLVAIEKGKKFAGEIFNIGSGEQQKISEVVEEIVKLTNSKSRLVWGALPYDKKLEPKIWQADLTKTKKLLGWQPKNIFEEGLAKTVDWYDKNLKLSDSKETLKLRE